MENSKEIFLNWLKENGAKNINQLKPEDGFADQIHGFINGSMCIVFFYPNKVTYTIFGETYEELPLNEFNERLKTLKHPKTEYTLERFKLKPNEQLIQTFEMCEEEKVMCTFVELKQRLN